MDASNAIVEITKIERKLTDTATAFLIDSEEMLRPNSEACFCPLIVAIAEQNSTAIVTVFIPPAVPTGEPPIIIKSIETSDDAFVRFSCGIEAKPAVLVVTD